MAELNYIQVTRACNQSCRFCSNPDNGRTLPLLRAKKLIDGYAAAKAAGVIFTGGEPTLYKDLDKLLSYAGSRKLPARITTNGQKCADLAYLAGLKAAGLEHIHFSIHSHKPNVHDSLTRTPGSLKNLFKAIGNAGKLGIRADLNVVINKLNSTHLHGIVEEAARRFPFVRHFVFNNMDPGMERAVEDPSTIPVLSEFEASLVLAMRALASGGRTFRVERVPLCFMAEFPHCATETRKLVKAEGRSTYFLDENDLVRQRNWQHGKSTRCASCSLGEVCAGLYKMGTYYDPGELCPLFTDPRDVRRRVREG